MSLLKTILGTCVGLGVLYLGIAVISPKRIELHQSTVVYSAVDAVYANVICLDRWDEWDTWSKLDPTRLNTISDKNCGAGSFVSWQSEDNVSGSYQLIKSDPNKFLNVNLKLDAFPGSGALKFTFTGSLGQTEVACQFQGSHTSLLLRPLNLVAAPVVNEYLRSSLGALKKLSEQNRYRSIPLYDYWASVEKIELPTRKFISFRSKEKKLDFDKFLSEQFLSFDRVSRNSYYSEPKLKTFLAHAFDDSTGDVSACVPFDNELSNIEGVIAEELSPKNGYVIRNLGGMSLVIAHKALKQYFADRSIELQLPLMEVYSNPFASRDSSWAMVIYPISD